MDAARQVLRFSIPGSLLLLLSTALVVVGRLIQGEHLANIAAALGEDMAAVVAIASAIPVGFLVYQIYYLGVRPFVWLRFHPWQRRWPRIDRGARVLSQLGPEALGRLEATYGLAGQGEALDADKEVTILSANPIWGRLGVQRLDPEYIARWALPGRGEEEAYHLALEAYGDRWRLNWDLLGALVEASSEYSDTRSLKVEYLILTDIYHSLGACRTACSMAWVLSTAIVATYVADGHGDPIRGLASIAVGLLASIALWLVLNQTRRQTWKAAERMLGFGFRRLIARGDDFLPGE
jgi:hypothetical protein